MLRALADLGGEGRPQPGAVAWWTDTPAAITPGLRQVAGGPPGAPVDPDPSPWVAAGFPEVAVPLDGALARKLAAAAAYATRLDPTFGGEHGMRAVLGVRRGGGRAVRAGRPGGGAARPVRRSAAPLTPRGSGLGEHALALQPAQPPVARRRGRIMAGA